MTDYGGDARVLFSDVIHTISMLCNYKWSLCKVKVKFSHTRYRVLGPELIPVYRQSARR